MRREPMAIAFALSLISALILEFRGGFDLNVLWPVVVGAVLTAAVTGIIATAMQFLPRRLFLEVTVVAGVAVALILSPLLTTFSRLWLVPLGAPTAFVWPLASVAGLLISRAAGVRFPHWVPRRLPRIDRRG